MASYKALIKNSDNSLTELPLIATYDSEGKKISSTYLKLSGGTLTGNISLYSPSGDSPSLIFQRGTLTDNYNDWQIQDRGGYLYFGQRGSGSSDFNTIMYITQSAIIGSVPFQGSLNGTSSNASKLNNQEASYYLNYNNLTNKPSFASQSYVDTKIQEANDFAVDEANSAANTALSSAKVYTDVAITNLINGAPEALNTLKELSDALQQHENEYDALLATVGGKLDKSGGTLTGLLTTQDLTINGDEQFGVCYTKVLLGTLSAGTAYANLSSTYKDGTWHRMWRLRLPSSTSSTPNFWGKIKITLYGTYSSFNASGIMSKTITCNYNGSSIYNNVGCYDGLGVNIEKDFRISEAIWNSTASAWEILIWQKNLSGNNNIPQVMVEAWANSQTYMNLIKNITPQAVELTQDTTYTAPKASSTGGTKTVTWATQPVFETPLGLEVADKPWVNTKLGSYVLTTTYNTKIEDFQEQINDLDTLINEQIAAIVDGETTVANATNATYLLSDNESLKLITEFDGEDLNLICSDGHTSTYVEKAGTAGTLNGLTSTITELNYTDGVTSNIQTQLNGKLPLSGGTMTGAINSNGNKIRNAHIEGGVIDTHAESETAQISYFMNDLTALRVRGGSCTVTGASSNPGTSVTDKWFDGTTSYGNFSVSATTDTVVILIKSFKNWTYGNRFGIGFGNSNWRAKSIKWEVGYATTIGGDPASNAWKTIGETTSNSNGVWICSGSGPTTGGSSTPWNTIRITLTNFNTTSPRIAGIWSINYSSSTLAGTLLPRVGGELYGPLTTYGNITPQKTGTYSLGSSSYKWNEVYATNFVGNLTGNITGMAVKATNDSNGNNIVATYATKSELGNINSILDAINGEVI